MKWNCLFFVYKEVRFIIEIFDFSVYEFIFFCIVFMYKKERERERKKKGLKGKEF